MNLNQKTLSRFLVLAACAIGGCTDTGPQGDPANGRTLFENGDGVNAFACMDCHCADASGGCFANAPNIQGESFAEVNSKTRDANVSHGGGKFLFAEQDAADIAAYLATLGAPKRIILPFDLTAPTDEAQP
jgi:cytochrome c553